MSSPADAASLLERHFLEVRARLLEVGATLDRLERASGSVTDDPRAEQLAEALKILTDQEGQRAERLQRLFSQPYDADWRTQLKV
ncbi:hypothetical protein FF011L_31110 [Roseimaritima multifibrata]|uniref:Uncharacterized protein n=1 Tax=Roseimaritima multifibrata TaxID=1930274 RepID=A0A517MHH7_9BACT|nr:hypothetical protein [Roseimaritima multifibrata]QDS94332.1 hypothetical protein FF011L_31110 [Roseimaritima multifibrata]